MGNKSIKRNYIYNLLYQLLVIIIPIITTPYISRVLGASGIGIYSYTISVTTYFIMIGTLGINTYGQRETAYVQDDKEKRSKIFYELFIIRMVATLISISIFYILFASHGEYSLYYKILLLELFAQIFDITWFFQGLEEFKKVVLRNFIVKIIFVLAIFLLVRTPNDVWKYTTIYAVSAIIGNLTLWFKLRKYLVKVKHLEFKKHIKPTLLLFLPQIAVQVYTVLDKTMLGFLLHDMSVVGCYEQAQKIVKISLTIITALGTVMIPRISNIYAKGNYTELKKQLFNSFRFVWVLSFPIIFGLIAVADHFVPVFYGPGFDSVKGLIAIFTIMVPVIGFANVIGIQYLLPTKQQNKYTLAVICGAIINLILNLILIPHFKAYGAAIATIVAEIVGLAIQIAYVWKEFDFVKIFKAMFKYLISGLVMFGLCLVVGKLITSNIVAVILQIVVGIISYFGTLYLINDDFIRSVFKRKVRV